MKNNSNPIEHQVVGVTQEAPDVWTLALTHKDGSIPPFYAGQFITVFFPETDTPEGKAYSISCAPGEGMRITVKAIGEFSHRLCAMKEGDTFIASLPYGFFYPEYEESDLVLLAGGIGITPFRGMIIETLRINPQRTIRLFYSTRREIDRIFSDEFKELQESHPNFTLYSYVTRETSSRTDRRYHRILSEEIVSCISKDKQYEVLLCGSISFSRHYWKALRAQGISEDVLYTEAFFSH